MFTVCLQAFPMRPCYVPLKLQSVDLGDQGPQRFHDHLFIHAIRSLIQGPEEPRLAAALSQQLSGDRLAHVLRSHYPAALLRPHLDRHVSAGVKRCPGNMALGSRSQTM